MTLLPDPSRRGCQQSTGPMMSFGKHVQLVQRRWRLFGSEDGVLQHGLRHLVTPPLPHESLGNGEHCLGPPPNSLRFHWPLNHWATCLAMQKIAAHLGCSKAGWSHGWHSEMQMRQKSHTCPLAVCVTLDSCPVTSSLSQCPPGSKAPPGSPKKLGV